MTSLNMIELGNYKRFFLGSSALFFPTSKNSLKIFLPSKIYCELGSYLVIKNSPKPKTIRLTSDYTDFLIRLLVKTYKNGNNSMDNLKLKEAIVNKKDVFLKIMKNGKGKYKLYLRM